MAMKHIGKEIGISPCIIMKYHLLVLTINLVFQIHAYRYWKGNFLPQFFTNTKPESTSLSHVDSSYKTHHLRKEVNHQPCLMLYLFNYIL